MVGEGILLSHYLFSPELVERIKCSLTYTVYCLTGNNEPGYMVEGQTFTIGECIITCACK